MNVPQANVKVMWHRKRTEIATCKQCPVRVACLDEALTEGWQHGIWGGTFPYQRR